MKVYCCLPDSTLSSTISDNHSSCICTLISNIFADFIFIPHHYSKFLRPSSFCYHLSPLLSYNFSCLSSYHCLAFCSFLPLTLHFKTFLTVALVLWRIFFYLNHWLTVSFNINATWYVMSSILLLLFQVSSISHVLAFALQYKHYFLLFWWSFNYFHCFGAKLCRCFHFHHLCHSCILLVQTMLEELLWNQDLLGFLVPEKP